MTYNLTESQKKLARVLVEEVRAGNLPETFFVHSWHPDQIQTPDRKNKKDTHGQPLPIPGDLGQLDALAEAKMLLQRIYYRSASFGESSVQEEDGRRCTLT